MGWLAKVPYYGFIGFIGVVGLIASVIAPFFDLMPGIAWCVLAMATLFYYLATIEAPVVECEWAGWIFMIGSLFVVMSGVFPVNIMVWVLAPLSILFAGRMYKSETFRKAVNLKLFKMENPLPKVREINDQDISVIDTDNSRVA
jgi:predicted membrane protein